MLLKSTEILALVTLLTIQRIPQMIMIQTTQYIFKIALSIIIYMLICSIQTGRHDKLIGTLVKLFHSSLNRLREKTDFESCLFVFVFLFFKGVENEIVFLSCFLY